MIQMASYDNMSKIELQLEAKKQNKKNYSKLTKEQLQDLLNGKEVSPVVKPSSVPKTLKIQVWNKYIGETAGIGKCYVCKSNLDSKHFEAGHIISKNKDGPTTLENLRPVCSACNKSIGDKNMDEFKKEYMTTNNIQSSVSKEYLINKYKLERDPKSTEQNTKQNRWTTMWGGWRSDEDQDKYRLTIEQASNILNDLRLDYKWKSEPTKENMDCFVLWLKKNNLYKNSISFFVNGYRISSSRLIDLGNRDYSFEEVLKTNNNKYYVPDETDFSDKNVVDFSYISINKFVEYLNYELKC